MVSKVAGKTDVGKKREINEDNFLIDVENNLFLVCDGMGGHKSGEVASRYACETINEFFQKRDLEITWEGINTVISSLPQETKKIITAVQVANQRIYWEAIQNPDRKGMGTTIAVLLLNKNGSATLLNVGDSRIYLIREGQITKLTRDHTWVNELLEDGEITEKEAENFIEKNVITRALGTAPTLKMDIYLEPVQKGDIFLLCSDGLWGVVPEEEIKEIIIRFRNNLSEACEALIKVANEYGGPDNITAVLVEIEEISALQIISPVKFTFEESEKIAQQIEKIVRKRYAAKNRSAYFYIPFLVTCILIFAIFSFLVLPSKKNLRKTNLPFFCKLEVKTDPSNARLFLNDKEIGVTPETIENLILGNTYNIKLIKEGYLIDSFLFTPFDSWSYRIRYLTPEAVIMVTYNRLGKADLVIDGKRVGSVEELENKSLPISKGRHQFEIFSNGNVIFSIQYEVKIDDEITIVPDDPDEKYRFRIKSRSR